MSSSAAPLNRLKYATPACATASEPCQDCHCGKANKKGSIWAFHYLSTSCADRTEPCSSECTCDRFQDRVKETPVFKDASECPSRATPCESCSCGKATLV